MRRRTLRTWNSGGARYRSRQMLQKDHACCSLDNTIFFSHKNKMQYCKHIGACKVKKGIKQVKLTSFKAILYSSKRVGWPIYSLFKLQLSFIHNLDLAYFSQFESITFRF